ncbi:WD40 repeat domain-containing protein, partial [Thiohalorhabdus methylotrophus]
MRKYHSTLATLLSLGCSVLGILWGSAVWANAGKAQTPTPAELEAQLEKWPPQLVIDTGAHQSPVADLMFSPDGEILYTVSEDKTVQVWDVDSRERRRVFRLQRGSGEQGKLYSGALSPDGEQLAVGCWDHAIRILDAQTGEVAKVLQGHTAEVWDLDFSPDGRYLVSGSEDETARVWDLESGGVRHVLHGHDHPIRDVLFSHDGNYIATGYFGSATKLWDARTGERTFSLGKRSDTFSLAFTPDSRHLITNYDGSGSSTGFGVWDVYTGELDEKFAIKGGSDYIAGMFSLSPDGKNFISGRFNYTEEGKFGFVKWFFESYSFPGSHLRKIFKDPPRILGGNTEFEWSPQGDIIATAGPMGVRKKRVIQLWDPKTGKRRPLIQEASPGNSTAVAFSEEGNAISWSEEIGSSFDRFTQQQTLQSRFLLPLPKNPSGSRSAVVSQTGWQRGIQQAGGTKLKINEEDTNVVEIWRFGSRVQRIDRNQREGTAHTALTLTPEGDTVISADRNGYIASYSTRTGEKLHEFVGHSQYVTSVAPSPDGRLLVSGSLDQTIRLWEIATGELLVTIFPTRDGEWVAWTPEGFFDASEHGA